MGRGSNRKGEDVYLTTWQKNNSWTQGQLSRWCFDICLNSCADKTHCCSFVRIPSQGRRQSAFSSGEGKRHCYRKLYFTTFCRSYGLRKTSIGTNPIQHQDPITRFPSTLPFTSSTGARFLCDAYITTSEGLQISAQGCIRQRSRCMRRRSLPVVTWTSSSQSGFSYTPQTCP